MYIMAGDKTIKNCTVYSERTIYNNVSRLALRIVLDGGITNDDIAALTSNGIMLYNEDGDLQGTHEGFNTVARHEIILAKISDMEALQDERDTAQQKLDSMKSGIDALQSILSLAMVWITDENIKAVFNNILEKIKSVVEV